MRQKRRNVAYLLVLLSCFVIGLAVHLLDGSSRPSRVLMGVGCVGLATVLQIVPHEAGHALMARLVGFTVHRIELGEGPLVGRCRFGSVVIEVRALPLTGRTIAYTGSARAFRSREWAVTAAGPAVTAAIGWWALRWQTAPGSPAEVIKIALFASSVALVVVNLFPWKVERAGEVVASDGWALMTLPTLSRDQVAALVAADKALARHERLLEAPEESMRTVREELEDPASDPVQSRVDLTNLLLHERRWKELLEVGPGLLDHVDHHDPGRPALLNALAWAVVCIDDATFVESADRWSAEALHLQPADPAVLNTRGGVHLMKGEVDRGLELVRRSAVPSLARTERAVVEAMLAIGESKRRNLFDARRHLAASMRADPNAEMLAHAKRAVSELAVDFESSDGPQL